MASEYSVTIRMEPFFQRFLCAQFDQERNDVFVFPARHDFNKLLSFLVQPVPADYKPLDYGEWTFRILLPHMEHKNVAVYNYLSQKGQRTFMNRVRGYMNMLFHDEMSKAVFGHGMTRIEVVDHLADSFGFTTDDYDRLLKEFHRWRNAETMRRKRRKEKV